MYSKSLRVFNAFDGIEKLTMYTEVKIAQKSLTNP